MAFHACYRYVAGLCNLWRLVLSAGFFTMPSNREAGMLCRMCNGIKEGIKGDVSACHPLPKITPSVCLLLDFSSRIVPHYMHAQSRLVCLMLGGFFSDRT